ncbi:MAG TPA: hypothetical protein VFX92_11690, partial [Candidatus Krumholzibacteria bacterium]|nr:hypothetical protein [Candidatus Krumholzibacteria bacterium]
VASVLGAPREAVEDGSWRMDGFIVGWCGEREQVSFAQALHRAAARMVRARTSAVVDGDGIAVGAAASETGPEDGQ